MKESFLVLFSKKEPLAFHEKGNATHAHGPAVQFHRYLVRAGCDPRLVPPVYWLAGGPTPLIAGIPCSIVYFVLLAAFIVGSLLAAYADDEKRGAFKAPV